MIACGTIRSKAGLSHTDRTGYLHDALYQLASQYSPEVCVMEKAFTGINPLSALRLGETRGALIAAVRRLGISVFEVTPTQVKKAITGQGHATKEQIAHALRYLLAFDRGDLPPDVSDAVAIGLSYGLSLGLLNKPAKSALNVPV